MLSSRCAGSTDLREQHTISIIRFDYIANSGIVQRDLKTQNNIINSTRQESHSRPHYRLFICLFL